MGVEGIGASVVRKEDKRFITGRGKYVDDIKLVGMTHAHFVRSPHAHARIRKIDASKALALPGVKAVVTSADFADRNDGLRDVLVEPRRAPLIGGFDAAKQAMLAAGAMGASISGAGPSVFGWFESKAAAEAAAEPVRAAFAAAGFDSQSWVSPIDGHAAVVLHDA